MKKLFSIIIVLFVTASLFAYQNTYTAESKEYKQMLNLCSLSGGGEPVNLVSPISADQMLIILNSIQYEDLPKQAKSIYTDLKQKLEHPNVLLKFSDNLGIMPIGNVSFQLIKQSPDESDWMLEKRDRKPIAEIGGEVFFNDYAYGYFNFDLLDIDNSAQMNSSNAYKKYTTNLMKRLAIMNNVDFTSPHRAFVSLGYSGMNLIIGRDRVSLGKGKTGNLILGDNLMFNDFVKASILNGPVSYDFTVLSYDNTNPEDHLKMVHDPYFTQKHQMVFLHNFSFSPVNWINISLTEGALSYGNSLAMDLKKLNPFYVLHSVFDYSDETGKNRGNMNNFFGLEIRTSLPFGIKVDAQAMFDQIQLGGEQNAEDPRGAQGFLVNISKSGLLFDGLFSAYLEGVYTSPNLYLKQQESAEGAYYNLDLIVGKKYFWSSSGNDDVSYLGYKYGPDTFALGTGFDWTSKEDKLYLQLDILYKMHGLQGIGQKDSTITYGESARLLTGENIETRLTVNFNAKYELNPYLSLDGEIGLLRVKNYHNTTESMHDLQWAVAFTFHPLEYIKAEKTL